MRKYCMKVHVWNIIYDDIKTSTLIDVFKRKLRSFLIDGRLTHWGRMKHICVGKLSIIGSDNGLSPGRRQAIIWTNAEILSIGPLGTNFTEIQIGIQKFSYKKMHLKMSSVKWRPFHLSLNMLTILMWILLDCRIYWFWYSISLIIMIKFRMFLLITTRQSTSVACTFM